MKIKSAGPLVCYLLHFDPPHGRITHYCGSTFERLLTRRLQQHAAKRGARLVSAAVEGGSRLALASVWPIFTRYDEMRVKRAGHLRRRCPICLGSLPFEDAPIITAASVDLPPWSDLSWPGSLVEGRRSQGP